MEVTESGATASLKAHPFTQGLTPEQIERLGRCARVGAFKAGVYLLRQGDNADAFYLIQSGRIALEIAIPAQGSLQIETIGPGEVFGWSWILPPYRLQFDVRIVSDVRAVVLNGGCLREFCEMDASLGYALLKRLIPVIGHRLQSTRLKLFELHGSTASVAKGRR